MEKYLYNENKIYNLKYNIGTKKGEYFHTIVGSEKIRKNDIMEVSLLEDIIVNTYKKPENALMIASMKWKIYSIQNSGFNCFYDKTSYDRTCSRNKWVASRFGKNLLSFLDDNKNFSISNTSRFDICLIGINYSESTFIEYPLPTLNYDILEIYYPGIKGELIKLDEMIDETANRWILGYGVGCYADDYWDDIQKQAKKVSDIFEK